MDLLFHNLEESIHCMSKLSGKHMLGMLAFLPSLLKNLQMLPIKQGLSTGPPSSYQPLSGLLVWQLHRLQRQRQEAMSRVAQILGRDRFLQGDASPSGGNPAEPLQNANVNPIQSWGSFIMQGMLIEVKLVR